MSNKKLIAKFYEGFQNHNADTMASCYHDDVVFSDPAFGTLKGNRAAAMWKMLCEGAGDLRIEYSTVEADENKGSVKWEAWYTFSQTGKQVHNKIDAKFKFKDGLIIEHHDSFLLRKWAGQAFGLKGKLLGGTSFFQKKLQIKTNKLLTRYIAK